MAENEPITPEAWNSPQLRRGILAKIQETLNSYGVTTNKSPAELERSVFQKANSKEQYLSFVARLIIHLKNNARPGMGVGGGAGGVQGPMGPGQHQQLNVMMQSGQGMPPQQMNLLQQQQAMHQNQQISALQQQQQQQQSIALQAQMKSQMGQQQQQQQMQMQQSQMMAGASNGLTLNNMPGGGGGPNAPKMNPMMNAGGNEAHGSEQQQMANMMAMQKAKQLNSHLAPNASIATSNISIVNSNFNPQMTINSNVNSSLANMSSNLNASSNINSQSASASTITSILNSANMKPKLVPNMMAPNANANAGGNLNAPHSITLNQQSATQQLQQGPGGPATQMSLQQQIAQHQQQQQQQNRMMQPGATLVTNHGGMVPNARMMMSQPGIRQQGNQINIPANLQAQLRLRQVNPGGPNSLQMANLQQGNQSGTIPIYLQQQQQQSQHPANQNGPNQSLGNQEPKFFEITNVNQPNQRITPVTVSQAQFKSMNVSSAGGNFVQTFNTSTLANAQQPQIVVSNSASMNALPGGIMSHSAAANNAANQMPPNLASQLSQQQQNKLNQAGSMGPQGVSSAQQVQAQAGNKLLSVPTPNTLLSSQNMNNIHSPSNFHINSPASVQSVPMMSPAGRATNSTIGAPSPQSALNTPASPGQAATPAQKTAAEQAYAEKLKSMQKYLQPLLNLISLLEKDERKAKELDRTRNLYCILVSQKKTSLDFLEKCELALEKMEREDRFVNRMGSLQAVEASPGMSSIPSVPAQTPANQQTAGPGAGPNVAGPTAATSQPPTSGTTTTAPGAPASNRIQDICKPLIDAVIANYDRPLFSHTLARTFGPALAVLHHEPYSVSNRVNLSGNYVYYSNTDPPRPKRKPSPEVQAAAIRNEVLQGEIARLDVRFNVQPLIPGKRSLGPSRAQHLLCRLDDLDLPCVPPIKVYVSELYPDIPPHYSLERADYQSSAFFLQLYTFFRENLFNMTGNYTLTALLLCWERSVRQAVCHDMEPSRGLKVAKVVDKENVRVSTPKIQIIN